MVLAALLLVVAAASATTATTISIANGGVTAELSTSAPDFGTLLSLTQRDHDLLTTPAASLWTASYANTHSDPVVIDGTSATLRGSATLNTASSVTLHWGSIQIGALDAAVNATLTINITEAGLCELQLSLSQPTVNTVALWQYAISIDGIAVSQSSNLLQNSGFGVRHSCSSSTEAVGCSGWSQSYPQSTFQFMGTWHDTASTPAFYFGAHDPDAESKTFSATVNNPGSTVGFSVQTTVPNAGVIHGDSAPGFVTSYPTVFGPVLGDWWHMAQVYRSWVLPNAKWTQKGPLAQRADVPAWLLNVTTWINSHWQQNDIFNISGGDPQLVQQRALDIADRFGPLVAGRAGEGGPQSALHWYEWDTLGYKEGSNYTECKTEVTCGFDTHYPEYCPV